MTSLLSSYARALRRPGTLAFSTSGFVARLPMAMVSLGIVLLVSDRVGSYSQAGAVSATFLLANAGCAVLQARWIDRWGQRLVLGTAAGVFAFGVTGLLLSVELDAHSMWQHVFAGLTGAGLPQIGAAVRARWSYLIEDKAELHTAFAFESVLDEAIFTIGPALTTVLATIVHPTAGLMFAGMATLIGTAVLVGHTSTEPPVASRQRHRSQSAMPWSVLAPLIGCAFTMGILLGGVEVATVATAAGQGSTRASGPLLSIWAVGSLISGVVTGAVAVKASTATRFRWATVALGVLVIPLPFVSSLVGIGACLFVSGCAISPILVAGFAGIEEAVPSERMTEGITLFTTGLGTGLAPGAGLTGWTIDVSGYSAGFWVPVIAGVAGAAIALATRGTRHLPRPAAAPGVGRETSALHSRSG
jgi:MFS family permease